MEIISFLNRTSDVSSTEIATQIKAHKETVREKLVKLCGKGVVKRIGRGNKTKYSLCRNHTL